MNKEQIERSLNSIRNHVNTIERELSLPDVVPPPKPLANKRIAVVVGHHRKNDEGASAVNGTTEVGYNLIVGRILTSLLTEAGAVVFFIKETPTTSYTGSVDHLANILSSEDCEVGLELHFNAYNTVAHGEEYLYWVSSANSKKLAELLIEEQAKADDDDYDRGVKPISEGRGSYVLRTVHCPYVICEPFFGDNPADWSYWQDNQELLARVYFNSLMRYFS